MITESMLLVMQLHWRTGGESQLPYFSFQSVLANTIRRVKSCFSSAADRTKKDLAASQLWQLLPRRSFVQIMK